LYFKKINDHKDKYEFKLLFPLIFFLLIASRILQFERENTRTHPVENSLWKRIWTCSKADHRMNDELHLQASIFNGFYVNIGIVSRLRSVNQLLGATAQLVAFL